MADNQYAYGASSRVWMYLALGSVVLIAVLIFLIPADDFASGSTMADVTDGKTRILTVYCAAGVRVPVEEAARQYEQEFGIRVRLDFGSSGAMEARLRTDSEQGVSRADIYIPADTLFSERAAADGLCRESIPLAQFSLVFATAQDDFVLDSVWALGDAQVTVTVCNESAAAGKKLRQALGSRWDELLGNRNYPQAATVVEAATWIKENKDIAGGFIWDSTARQFGLRILDLPELTHAQSTISANICTRSAQPTAALHFSRYLSAPDKGGLAFAAHQFASVNGDAWADIPEIIFYCGGLNRNAVDPIIEAFRQREAVRVITKYNGCGVLVAEMKGIIGNKAQDQNELFTGMPDVYMTCDASFMEKVQDSFQVAHDISTTNVVMVVRAGNPRGIHTITDLANADLRVGTTNPEFSTLGSLSWQLFSDEGILDANGRIGNITKSAGTAHELLLQMENQHVLDCVLVYQANCQNLSKDYEIIAIKNKLSIAVQNIAAAKGSRYPQTVGRLLKRIQSMEAAKSFLDNGFNWMYKSAGDR